MQLKGDLLMLPESPHLSFSCSLVPDQNNFEVFCIENFLMHRQQKHIDSLHTKLQSSLQSLQMPDACFTYTVSMSADLLPSLLCLQRKLGSKSFCLILS